MLRGVQGEKSTKNAIIFVKKYSRQHQRKIRKIKRNSVFCKTPLRKVVQAIVVKLDLEDEFLWEELVCEALSNFSITMKEGNKVHM